MQSFDNAALNYDEQFTYSSIGSVLRNRVWRYMSRLMPPGAAMDILELNCGTGEDAIHFGKQGHRVLGLDISGEMIRHAKQKLESIDSSLDVSFEQLDSRCLNQLNKPASNDLVFSDFGGLNCLNPEELKDLSVQLHQKLRKNGRFVGVVMGKFCLWESTYFLLKAEWKNIFRRNTNKKTKVLVDGSAVDTWYYSPAAVRRLFYNEFSKIRITPLGLFLPPPYLEPFFSRQKTALNILGSLEDVVVKVPFSAYLADHYIIDLQRK